MNLLGDTVGQNAVRKPSFAISFGNAGPGGLAAAADTGSGEADPWSRNTLSVNVEVGMAPCVDRIYVCWAADDQAPEVTLDEEGTISLGYIDTAPELVFTAKASGIDHDVTGLKRFCGVNGGMSLSKLRCNQSYEQQNAADIVNDLAGQAGVETDSVENGIDYPYYVIDDRQNAYQAIYKFL